MKELMPYIMIVISVLLIRYFVITPVVVDGISMNNTLAHDDVLLLRKFDKSYERDDIVVVKREVENDLIIKRIIALPGDTIEAKEGFVYVNGKKVIEDYSVGITVDFESLEVPKNHYFVMGDNRMSSDDSRRMGAIHKKYILGTVSFRIYPFDSFGKID